MRPSLLLISCAVLLSACSNGPELEPYDYDKREKARVKLPRDTSVDVDPDEVMIKKKITLPAWGL